MSFNMPPGFRFHPTDEELVVHFLHRKTKLLPCHPDIIPDLDLHPYDPWDLNGKAMAEGSRWYFYSRKTQSRVTGSGYWQPFGAKDEHIYSSSGHIIGIRKHYEFYIGELDSNGVKTNWVMQEFRLSDSSSSSTRSSRSRRNSNCVDHSKWVLCRVYEGECDDDGDDDGIELSCLDEVFLSMDDFDEISLPN
ncbi:hypothetical protein F511_13286 [Dorcoceras hygrometricum]|uniref:NAC domain-containing protein n=1 Tax=Dorcoceras hygrometricum TaxID=472368 RepID=A0A2Z7BTR3_9LAMI|nr:hypothetical protein F511_13286 [Dorcoceras hygrometricum]